MECYPLTDMKPRLSALLADVDLVSIHDRNDPEISGLEYDSRRIVPGSMFFALPGIHSDGHRFIDAAIRKGACAIVHEQPVEHELPGTAYLRVRDARTAMSRISAAFHGHPSRSLHVIGVTGTEGKSTTVYLLYQLLSLKGFRTGFFSTVMSDPGSGEKPNPEHQTTPESTAVHGMLASMRDAGCSHAVVEASSHGLSERTARLLDVSFDIGVVTNVTTEHLEFHGTWERYRSDKARLFRSLDAAGPAKSPPGSKVDLVSCGVVNADDPSAAFFAESTSRPVFSCSARGAEGADFRALELRSGPEGSRFIVEGPASMAQTAANGNRMRISREAFLPIPGDFNVSNCLEALAAAAAATQSPWQDFIPLLSSLKPVRGRMMKLARGQPFELVIDYAHTPSSFEAVLPTIRKATQGRLFCLFGSGGERDTAKRPMQGAVAARYCDIVILTDEDPRGEDPRALLEDIAAGCPELPRDERLFIIPDRPKAIRKAFSMARKGDTVLLLGKGHENSIIYADHVMPYDEEAEAVRALAEMGHGTTGADEGP
jgi:UDP-N-acetylmuramoyl-L-alanyl-D-glutamate--2,6-diaminopimelate ligase